ncbi:MAG: hypothetical protein LBU32_17275 [Clostridiales bacterium]|nr:hypothetical protein [Clostridiales bacterium]
MIDRLKESKKYLFLLPIVLMIAFSMFFRYAFNELQNQLLSEKFMEKKALVDLLADHTDYFIAKDDDWETEYDYYRETLIRSCEEIDRLPMTFAALYNDRLEILTTSEPSYSITFSPLEYDDFHEAIQLSLYGELNLYFNPPDSAPRTVRVFYRWVPTDVTLEGRLLMVVGISTFSINNNISSWVVFGAILLIAVTTFLNFAMVGMLNKMSSPKIEEEKKISCD